MDDQASEKLIDSAKEVLEQNNRRLWTVPAADLYPHQWLWDSCFIAIGLRHIDIERAKTELRSLLRGQWGNGMLPNIIFDSNEQYTRDREIWRSYISPYAPKHVATSGITQPPMLAEAVLKVGEKLRQTERRSWYREMYPAIVSYHEWMYEERDPHQEGLIILVHPYECGLDSTPSWISELRKHSMPFWVSVIEKLRLDRAVNMVRRDTKHVPSGQRMSNIEALAYWSALHRLRRKAYNSEAILGHPLFAIEDLVFNSILIRANGCLKLIAEDIGKTLPESLLAGIGRAQKALEQLWDENSAQYFSRSFISHKLIEETTIATFLPLYSGAIPKEKAQHLVESLKQERTFWPKYPVPSVPLDSPHFNPNRYWQGPTWVNTNWLIIEGLKSYGYEEDAKELADKTIDLVSKNGMNEYFDPSTGGPEGAPVFSWTAALTIDLLKSR